MFKVYFDGQLTCGAYIQNARLIFDEEPTMVGLVNRLRDEGYTMFRLPHMPKLVKI